MELDDLKSAWSQYTDRQVAEQHVPVEEFSKIIGKRTLDITDRIGRNIRVGILIMLLWTGINFGIDFILAPILEGKIEILTSHEDMLMWSSVFEVVLYLLLFAAIAIFWYRFKKIEKANLTNQNLKNTLVYLINIITSYKKMFYILLGVIILFVSVLFSSGFYAGFTYEIEHVGLETEKMKTIVWVVVIFLFLLFLGLFIAFYCLLFSFFFKRLYGRYLKQLQQTLSELSESVVND